MHRAGETVAVHGQDQALRVESRLHQYALGEVSLCDRRVVAMLGERLVQKGDERGQVRRCEVAQPERSSLV